MGLKQYYPKYILKQFAFLVFIGCTYSSYSQTIISVCDTVTLMNTLKNSLAPGSRITLCNTFNWDSIQIRVKGTGTAAMPIILRADTIGKVSLTGNSSIAMGGEYIIVDGFTFEDGEPKNNFVIDFQFNTSTPCSNCLLKNVTIDAYDSEGMQDTSRTINWVRMHGQYNEVAHCSFLRRQSKGSCIAVVRDSMVSDYHKIHHNYFAHRTSTISTNQNGQEAIRIGSSKTWKKKDASCEVYNNYFYDWFGEAEIISNKSSNNKYYNNTFAKYMGALTLRQGNDCEVYNNFFLAKNNNKSGGIRVFGERHKIYKNYIDSINNGSSRALGAINISNGEMNPPDSGYHQVKDALIVFNTIVDGDKGIRVGTMLDTQLIVAPNNCIIANNLMQDTDDAIEWIINDTLSVDTFYNYWNNTRSGGYWDLDPEYGLDNDTTSAMLLETTSTDNFRRVKGGTIAIDKGVGNFQYVSRDIQGGIRPTIDSLKDAGAEEYGVYGINHPYMPADTSILIGAGSGFWDNCYSNDSIVLPYLYIPEQTYQTSQFISGKGIIRSSYNIDMIAKDSILLLPGFEVILGADLDLNIDDCNND